ncbi:MAG TPA: AraC family ligand binding domain-containing protein [Longimicrobiales bacterium]|nr:AraC family ligand binding domain-containing protein [Longimicrobiales bacterium]
MAGFPEPRADRHASAVLHDEANVRLIAFSLGPGQVIGTHRSASTVLVHVVRGSGRFEGEAGAAELEAGGTAVYAPDEAHGMTAGADGLEFLAVLSPGPSMGRQGRLAGDAADGGT